MENVSHTLHAFHSDALRMGSQRLEITYVGRQHGCSWLGMSNNNGVDGGSSARPSAKVRRTPSD
ncbi:MAG TPA: hypothetical protein VFN67_35440 [Polyangiales bacterium]|nr:hypothetical protein [Polyangiales bacterium]